MVIKNLKARLEGSYRLVRIRKIKLGFFIMQLILALVLALVVSFMVGMRFDPFFFPSDIFSFVFLIILLAITAESVYFKGLEIRYTKSKSRRFLIARNSIRRSIVIIAVSLFFMIMLLLPSTGNNLAEGFGESHSQTNLGDLALDVSSNPSIPLPSFPSSDPLGLVYVDSIEIEVNSTSQINAVIVDDRDYSYIINGPPYIFYLEDYISVRTDFNVTLELPTGSTSSDGSFRYTVDYRFSNIFGGYIPILTIVFIMIQLTSITIMYPLRELYATSSIYSKRYVEEKAVGVDTLRMRYEADAGELSEEELRKAMEEEEKEDALLEDAIAIEDVVTADADEIHRVDGILRKKGEVDEGLTLEADVQCGKCGEMNSPHAAMCFVCGTPMVEREEVEVNIPEIIGKGDMFLMDRKFDQALECYDHVLMLEKTNKSALLGKSKVLNFEGKWGLAVQYVNTILNIDPNNVEALIIKGNILEGRGKLERALEVYQQALDIDPAQKPAMERKEAIKARLAELESFVDEDEIIEQFIDIPGIGLAKATALYQGGFTSLEKLKAATEDELAQVKGISPRIAKKILNHLYDQ